MEHEAEKEKELSVSSWLNSLSKDLLILENPEANFHHPYKFQMGLKQAAGVFRRYLVF